MQPKAVNTQLDYPRATPAGADLTIDRAAKVRPGEPIDDAAKRLARRLEKKRLYAESLARKSDH